MHFSKMNPETAIYKITNIIEKPRDGKKVSPDYNNNNNNGNK